MKTKTNIMKENYTPGMTAAELATVAGSSKSLAYGFIKEHGQKAINTAVTLTDSAPPPAVDTEMIELINNLGFENETLKERLLAQLELALEDRGWLRLTHQAQREFSREGINTIIELARIMRLKNPIIFRGVQIGVLYVFAQGVAITANDPDINDCIQEFMKAERNRKELFSALAYQEKEQELKTDANIFFALFTNRGNGRVTITTIDPMEISNIITNPHDAKEPWYYRRQWADISGHQEAYYPDKDYTPEARPDTINGKPVKWDSPVLHVAINKLSSNNRFGISEIYPALDWAKSYKKFLENLATVWAALARFAYKVKVGGGKTGRAAAQAKLSTTLNTTQVDSNPSPVTGSNFIHGGTADIEPIKWNGATVSADDGRRFMLMAVMVFGYPETFYGDVSVGSLATAESLDRPTELLVMARQQIWTDVFTSILRYVVLQAAIAPNGKLSDLGAKTETQDGNEIVVGVEWGTTTDPDTGETIAVDDTINVVFPPVVQEDINQRIDALVKTTTLNGQVPAGTLTLEVFTSMALTALGAPNVPELVDVLFPEGEEESAPPTDPAVAEERAAVLEAITSFYEDIINSRMEASIGPIMESVRDLVKGMGSNAD